MATESLYRVLVPDAPPHRRTEYDPPGTPSSSRRPRAATPGLARPRLVSSCVGSIDRLLLCIPSWALDRPELVAGYRSLIASLRPGTRFVVAHHRADRPTMEPWFRAAGHDAAAVDWAPLAPYVAVTDWAEDAYVALTDADDGTLYLMEPWTFGRVGDSLIADAVEEHTDIRATTTPLIFQGGNCLIGDDFWLLGKDYLIDTVELLTAPGSPVEVPPRRSPHRFALELFEHDVDRERRLLVIGSRDPLPAVDYVGRREGDQFLLEIVGNGVGTYQPIFHIDMFITPIGRLDGGRFGVSVGSPALGARLLGTPAPFAHAEAYDRIARSLRRAGFSVHRTPLVHRSRLVAQFTLAELRDIAESPGGDALTGPVGDLEASGAGDSTPVDVRDWHHVTWNNCLVENSAAVGRHVYLPTFGHGPNADLAAIDEWTARFWSARGFTVHALADFNPFAERQGVVHCIKKYLERGA